VVLLSCAVIEITAQVRRSDAVNTGDKRIC
jgi:hypothetical protein